MIIDIKGFDVEIDEEDLPFVKSKKWNVHKGDNSNTWYAYTWTYENKTVNMIQMHRLLMGVHGDNTYVVDHIDHNGLNNRRSNLRLCLSAENSWNQQLRKNNTTGYKGVSLKGDIDKYYARIMKHYVAHDMGCYKTPEEAAVAYDIAALHLFGEYACTNFDKEAYKDMDIEAEYNRRHYVPTCEYRGVSKREGEKFAVSVCLGRKVVYIGAFPTAEQAAEEYDMACIRLGKENPKLNFPERVVDGVYNKEIRNGTD